jgi:hypothetical protein
MTDEKPDAAHPPEDKPDAPAPLWATQLANALYDMTIRDEDVPAEVIRDDMAALTMRFLRAGKVEAASEPRGPAPEMTDVYDKGWYAGHFQGMLDARRAAAHPPSSTMCVCGKPVNAAGPSHTCSTPLPSSSVGAGPEERADAPRRPANLHVTVEEYARVCEELSEAAREINCAGPIPHRIRVLKSEMAERVSAARREGEEKGRREAFAAVLDADCDEHTLSYCPCTTKCVERARSSSGGG